MLECVVCLKKLRLEGIISSSRKLRKSEIHGNDSVAGLCRELSLSQLQNSIGYFGVLQGVAD